MLNQKGAVAVTALGVGLLVSLGGLLGLVHDKTVCTTDSNGLRVRLVVKVADLASIKLKVGDIVLDGDKTCPPVPTPTPSPTPAPAPEPTPTSTPTGGQGGVTALPDTGGSGI